MTPDKRLERVVHIDMTSNSGSLISVSGKTALVTGASSGIGAAAALALGRAGANVIVHYNRQEREAADIVKQLSGFGVGGEIVQADLSTKEGVDSLCSFASSKQIDILVNNAGSLVERTRVLQFTHELWEKVMMLNLTSAFFLSQAVLTGMAERKSGVIINMSSVAARFGGGLGAVAYSASKAAVSTMTKGLTKEFAPLGVRVNCISPGTIDTSYHRTFSTAEGLDAIRAATPIGRLGTAEEIADLVVFLASDKASFIHGQVIEINGGFLMA
jgi:NAD(P)-dependent dehydrogenase (short-subunit alcohol dehydrogenase family)